MTVSEQWIAFRTILRKEFLRFARIWVQTILPPIITMSLYFVIFGNLIGSQLAGIKGYSYIQYIVPGLIMMPVITNSYANVVSSFFSAKFQKHIEEMLVSPMPNYIIILGFVAGGVTRGLVVGAAVALVSMLFSPFQIEHFTLLFAVVLLTSILFSLAGLINGIFAKSFDDISIVPTFVLTPLTYLGGIFYSVDMLPDFWRGASHLNPIFYMVDTFRNGMLGVSDVPVALSFAIITGFVIVLYATASYLLGKGVGIRS